MRRLLLLLLLGLLPSTRPAGAETPITHLLPLQGFATDAAGLPLAQADLVVRIYDSASGGEPVYDSGADFLGAVQRGCLDVVLGSGTALRLDATTLYHMEVEVDGVEMIGDGAVGRRSFYPGGGDHSRPDLEARLDALEALFAGAKRAPASAPAFEGSGSGIALEAGLLGIGRAEGSASSGRVVAHLLLQPVGIFAAGGRVLKLGPAYLPRPGPPTAVDRPGPPLRTRLLPCYPNPFNPQTTVAFELARRGPVRLRVYDVAGRRVRVLVDGEILEARRHEVLWNGRDDGGAAVASGTYFYRLEAGEYVETRSLVLVK